MRQIEPENQTEPTTDITDCRIRRIDELKIRAHELGLTPYAGLYGDRRRLDTWQKLLASENLQPLPPRQIETSNRPQIDWKLAIALFVGAIALLCLLKPIADKTLPVRINIQIGESK